MALDHYQQPARELPEPTRTFARMILSLIEEAQAIDWYEQRMAVEKNEEAKAIMLDAQQEEMRHFCLDLDFLLRQRPAWKHILDTVLSPRDKLASEVERRAA